MNKYKLINNSSSGGRIASLLVVLFLIILAYAVALDGLPQAGSDPLGTTVVSQNIIDNHDIFVLHGKFAAFFKRGTSWAYQVQYKNGHVYYYFPIGTAMLITPLVYINSLFGIQSYNGNNDAIAQEEIVMIISFFIMMTVFIISRHYYSTFTSALISALSYFGTLVGPTVGTGLWSIDLEVLFTALTILIFLNINENHKKYFILYGVALGIIFFFGFLVRPTFAILIIGYFAYLFFINKKILAISAIVSGCMLSLFVAYCLFTIGAILPPYYLLSRLSSVNAYHAFFGLLFSPSRSIFVFTPALLLIPFMRYQNMPNTVKNLIYTLFLVMAALFLTNIFFPHWDAGWSYGPRILTGFSFIGVVILIITVGSMTNSRRNDITKRIFISLLFLGCLVDINGMYNPYAEAWNAYPRVGINPDYIIWSLNYPQPLVNREMLIDKCYSQSRYLGLNSLGCTEIGTPYPGSKFFSFSKKEEFKQFKSLYAAASCYIKTNHSTNNITPLNAERNNCLSKKFGGFPTPAANDNWTSFGGWLGIFGKDKSSPIGVGVSGTYLQLSDVIEEYKSKATEIYFPYPNKLNINSIDNNQPGQLLMIFPTHFFHKE